MNPPRESLNHSSGDNWDSYRLLIMSKLDSIGESLDRLNATIESHKKDIDQRIKPLELKMSNIYFLASVIACVAGIIAGGVAHAF